MGQTQTQTKPETELTGVKRIFEVAAVVFDCFNSYDPFSGTGDDMDDALATLGFITDHDLEGKTDKEIKKFCGQFIAKGL